MNELNLKEFLMPTIDRQYEDLLEDILKNGKSKGDRTGTGTISKFGAQIRYDLSKGFPLITTKKVFMRGISEELFWFLNGDTNVKTLQDKNVHIWDEWRKPYNFNREIVLINKKHKNTDNWEKPEWTKEEFYELFNDENGEIYNSLNKVDQALFTEWMHMMVRCYYSDETQKGYYEPDNSVVKEWFNYENFLNDAKKLPHYWYWKESMFGKLNQPMHLNIGYYDANYYGPDSCVWLDPMEEACYGITVTVYKEENGEYKCAGQEKVNGEYVIKITDPIGNAKIYIDEEIAARKLKVKLLELKDDSLITIENSKNDYTGYTVEKVYPPENKLFRLKLIEDGELGNVYGAQWRNWETKNGEFIDQISELIENLKKNPDSRRHIISAWNVGEIDNMALPPCHTLFQFYVVDGKLSCQLYQRSGDYFLGVCYNLASYSLLTHMIAQQVGLEVGDFIWTGGDVHIYNNHIEQVKEQLSREPYPFPTIKLNKAKDIFSYTWDDIEIVDYKSHPAINAPIAV